MANPFFDALVEGGRFRGIVPALFRMGSLEREQAATNEYMSTVQQLMQGVPGQPSPQQNPDVLAGGGQPMPQALPAQAGTPGLPPARALLEAFMKNPRLIADLPEDVATNAQQLAQLFAQQEGTPTERERNLAAYQAAFPDAPLTPQQGAEGFGFGAPQDIQLAQMIPQILGREMTTEEKQRLFGLIQSGPQTTVNVGAPNLGPVFEFLKKEQGAERQDEISAIDRTLLSLSDAIAIVSAPNASQFVGVGGSMAELAAPFTSWLGQLQGDEQSKAFAFFGPDVKTLGQARATLRMAMIDGARAVLGGDIGRLSNQERAAVNNMMANPDAFMTSPQQLQGALGQLQSYLYRVRRQSASELEQGGVNTAAPEVTTRSEADWAEITRIASEKQKANPNKPLKDLVDEAEAEFDRKRGARK